MTDFEEIDKLIKEMATENITSKSEELPNIPDQYIIDKLYANNIYDVPYYQFLFGDDLPDVKSKCGETIQLYIQDKVEKQKSILYKNLPNADREYGMAAYFWAPHCYPLLVYENPDYCPEKFNQEIHDTMPHDSNEWKCNEKYNLTHMYSYCGLILSGTMKLKFDLDGEHNELLIRHYATSGALDIIKENVRRLEDEQHVKVVAILM